MSEEALHRNLQILGDGYEACAEKNLQLPALTILYSAIDICAWLAYDDTIPSVGTRYKAWLDEYILKAKSLPCTSEELYAARCGILHTLTAESNLSATGKARLVLYVWGNKDAHELNRAIIDSGMDREYFAVHIEDLYQRWKLGLIDFYRDLLDDPSFAARVFGRAAKFFDSNSSERIDGFIQRAGTGSPIPPL